MLAVLIKIMCPYSAGLFHWLWGDCVIASVLVEKHQTTSSPFNLHGLTLIPACISNYNRNKVWDEIFIHS